MKIRIDEYMAELAGMSPTRAKSVVARWIFEALRRLPRVGLLQKTANVDIRNRVGNIYVASMPPDMVEQIEWFYPTNYRPTADMNEARATVPGTYSLSYYGLETDEDGYPITPETHREAVLSYILWQHWLVQGRIDPTRMPEAKMFEQEYYTAARVLTGQTNTQSVGELNRMIVDNKKPQW